MFPNKVLSVKKMFYHSILVEGFLYVFFPSPILKCND